MLSKIQIDILNHLLDSGLIDQMNSRSIRRISDKIGLNYFRVRTNINHLVVLGLVANGFKERQSNCYHITKKGVEILNE